MLAVSTTAGLLATVTLLLSAVGGWIAGLPADRTGRVRTLQITNLWFSLFTSLQGFAQSFEQLFVFRALMVTTKASCPVQAGPDLPVPNAPI